MVFLFHFFKDCLQPLSMQALPDSAESLCIVEMGGKEGSEETRQGGGLAGLFLNIGLEVEILNTSELFTLVKSDRTKIDRSR